MIAYFICFLTQNGYILMKLLYCNSDFQHPHIGIPKLNGFDYLHLYFFLHKYKKDVFNTSNDYQMISIVFISVCLYQSYPILL